MTTCVRELAKQTFSSAFEPLVDRSLKLRFLNHLPKRRFFKLQTFCVYVSTCKTELFGNVDVILCNGELLLSLLLVSTAKPCARKVIYSYK